MIALANLQKTHPNSEVAGVMLRVILALVPTILALFWYFGWGVLINIGIGIGVALFSEAAVLFLRARPVIPVLCDGSAVVTGLLLAIALPPLLPWWVTVVGVAFAIVVVKQLYGGLGFNPFNPAMAAYVLLLISFPLEMTRWSPPLMLVEHSLGLWSNLQFTFLGSLPAELELDALTMATPLDFVKTQIASGEMMSDIHHSALFGNYGGQGWEWVGVYVILGGLYLIWAGIIRWHIPAAMLGSLAITATFFTMIDPDLYPFALFHIFSGGALLGAFFIATDPVSGCASECGRLWFAVGVGVLTYIIRAWGGYPDGVAFAVLIMNMAAPLIDHYTRPRTFGHRRGY